MSPRKRLLIGIGLILSIILLIFSILNTRKDEEGQPNLTVSVADIEAKESLRISTEPRFDFTYKQTDDSVTVQPLTLLRNDTEYTISVQYFNAEEQLKEEQLRFIYEDSTKAMELIKLTPLVEDEFTLYSTDRHHFYVLVTSSGITEEEARVFANKLFEEYDIVPGNVEIEVEFSRGAKEDGSHDPFAPVPAR